MSFQAVQAKIAAKEGISGAEAGAILASSTRKASPAAKRKNPKLRRVLMPKKHRSAAHKAVADFGKTHGGSEY